jgi:hypothetical protein
MKPSERAKRRRNGRLQYRILVVTANSVATVIKYLMERYQFFWILACKEQTNRTAGTLPAV